MSSVSPAISQENYPTLFSFVGLQDPPPVPSDEEDEDHIPHPQPEPQDAGLGTDDDQRNEVTSPQRVTLRPGMAIWIIKVSMLMGEEDRLPGGSSKGEEGDRGSAG